MIPLGPPYFDIRIPIVEITVGEFLREFPDLDSINLHPFASGPEIELVFGTPEDTEPRTLGSVIEAVERTGITVFASRRRTA